LELTLLQRIKLYLTGTVYLEHQKRPGWTGYLPFYAVKCPIHGVFEDYPHGFDDYFLCPQCYEERWSKATQTDLVEQEVQEVLGDAL